MKPLVVGISEYVFARAPQRIVTYGLGSCVALALYAPDIETGAMAHIMLPNAFGGDEGDMPGKFADTAVASMVERMSRLGVPPVDLVAKMAGGADMFAGRFVGTGSRIGTRNVLSARRALDEFGIPLVAQDVGGTQGRTAELDTATGRLIVRTLRGGVKEL